MHIDSSINLLKPVTNTTAIEMLVESNYITTQHNPYQIQKKVNFGNLGLFILIKFRFKSFLDVVLLLSVV